MAETPRDPNAFVRFAERVWGVQFHPEFDAERARALCEEERPALEQVRPGLADRALASIRPTPDAERVLSNWVRSYVGA